MYIGAEFVGGVRSLLLSKVAERHGGKSQFYDISLDVQTRELIGPSDTEKLSPNEFQIFWLLLRAQGEVVSMDEFHYFLYEDDENKDIPLYNSVEVLISRIRKKLKNTSNLLTIEINHGFGHFLKYTE